MTVGERRTYLGIVQDRLGQAIRNERGQPLDEMARITGLYRENLMQLMNRDLARQPRHHITGWFSQFLASPGAEEDEAKIAFDAMLPAGRGESKPYFATLQAWPTEAIHSSYGWAKARTKRAKLGISTK